jgi:soluble P-type ATPase
MISVDIPWWENLDIENVVFDVNGTVAEDGKILPGVKEKIHSLSEVEAWVDLSRNQVIDVKSPPVTVKYENIPLPVY